MFESGLPLALSDFGVKLAVTALGEHWDSRLDLLFPSERHQLTGMTAKRRREFIAGRALAHLLMRRLATTAAPARRHTDRSPDWPVDICGSITHTDSYCWVALARTDDVFALGIDLEPRQGLEPALWAHICRSEELRAMPPSVDAGTWVRWVFCAKEAFYKAQFPHTRKYLEHADLAVILKPDSGCYRVTCRVDLGGAWPAGKEGTGLLAWSDELLGAAWVVGARPRNQSHETT